MTVRNERVIKRHDATPCQDGSLKQDGEIWRRRVLGQSLIRTKL
jgi:hypothetical protein